MAVIQDFIIRIKQIGKKSIDDTKRSVDDLTKSADKANGKLAQLGGGLKDLGSQAADAAGLTNNLGTSLAGIGRVAGPIGAAIGLTVGAIGALAFRAIESADAIQDLSDATGVSAGRLLSFKQSIIDSGGKAEDFEKITTKLSTTLGDAAEGNEKLRKSFKDLGVNLGDANGNLRSTDELLPEIIAAIAKIEDPAVRSAKAVELLGKSAARIDWTNVKAVNDPFKDAEIAQLAKYRGELDKLANTVEKQLITAFGKLAIAINQGPKEAIFELLKGIEKLTDYMPNMIIAKKALQGVGIDYDAVRESRNRQIQEAISPVGGGRGRMAGPTAAELSKAFGKSEKTGDLKDTPEMIAARASAIAAAKAQTDALRQQGYEARNLEGILNNITEEYLIQNKHSQLQSEILKSNARIDSDRDNKIAEFNRQIAAESANTQRDSRVTAAIIGQIKERIAETREQAELQKKTKSDELTILDRAKALENARLLQLQNITSEFERQKALAQGIADIQLQLISQDQQRQFQLAQRDRTPAQRERAQIVENARVGALQEGRAFAARPEFNTEDGLTPETARRLSEGLDLIAKKWKNVSDNQLENLDNSQKWATGWQEAFNSYVDTATTAAQQAADAFTTITSQMEDALTNFVKTGKLNFKDMVRSIILDLTSKSLVNAFKNLMGMMGGGGGGGSFLSSIGSFLGSFLGFADGGNPPVNKPSIVGERGPELFVPKTAGTIIPNGGMGATTNNNTYITNNISALDAKSVAQLFAENRRTLLGATEQARKEMPIRQRF